MTTQSVAAPPAVGQAAPAQATETSSPSRLKGVMVFLVTLLVIGAAGVWGYSQWWAPMQQADRAAQVKYDQCLAEVKAYEGTPSYQGRVDQCASLYSG